MPQDHDSLTWRQNCGEDNRFCRRQDQLAVRGADSLLPYYRGRTGVNVRYIENRQLV